jgi:hypothetical protein
VFAIAYFSNLSVAFNLASLHRLRDVATHKNSFGLSLYTFPRSLTCSTYRLPTGDAVDMTILCDADPATREKAQAAIEGIARAFKKQPSVKNTHHDRGVVGRYIKASSEQSSIESTGYDIKSLAESLAWLPNVRGVGCLGDSKFWGQEDWEAVAGFKNESFLYLEYLASGGTNLTVATRKFAELEVNDW